MGDDWVDYTDPFVQQLENVSEPPGTGGSLGLFSIRSDIGECALFQSYWRFSENAQAMVDGQLKRALEVIAEKEREADVVT